MWKWPRAGRSSVGLDIGTQTIKVVEIIQTARGPQLSRYGIAPTPANAVDDGAIKDPQVLAQAVRKLFREAGIRAPRVITKLIAPNLLIRHVEFPQMSEDELRSALEWEAEQYIPLPKEERVVDLHIISRDRYDEGRQTMKVLLVATQRQPIVDYVAMLKTARLIPTVIDIEPAVLGRVVDLGQGETGRLVVVISMGSSGTVASLFADGVLQMTRTINLGGSDMTSRLAERLGCSWEQAEQRKLEAGLDDSTVALHLTEMINLLLSEIIRSIEFYLYKNRELTLDSVRLVGGAACLKGFAGRLKQELTILDPLHRRAPDCTVAESLPEELAIDEKLIAKVKGQEAVLLPAIGLAIRGVRS